MKPKVLFCGEFARKNNLGGSCTSNFEILNYLVKRGVFEIKAISPIFKDEMPEEINLPVTFIKTRYFRSKSFGDLLCKLDFKRQIEKFIKETKFEPDAIFIDAGTYFCQILPDVPKVLSIHGSQKYKGTLADLFKHPYSNICVLVETYHENKAIHNVSVKKVITNSEFSKNLLINDYNLSSGIIEKTEAVPRGYNIERFSVGKMTKDECKRMTVKKLGLNGAENKIILMFVGGIAPHKGQLELVNSMPSLIKKYPNTILILIGKDCGNLNECQKATAEYNLKNNVYIFDRLSDKELGVMFKGADIYVSASFEGFGINLVEAMAFGLPLVAWDKGAVKELFSSGREGFLVDKRDDFINKAGILIENSNLRKNMGKAAKKSISGKYQWDELGHKVEEALINSL